MKQITLHTTSRAWQSTSVDSKAIAMFGNTPESNSYLG